MFKRKSRRMFGRRRRRSAAPALVATALVAAASIFYAQIGGGEAAPSLSATRVVPETDIAGLQTLRLPAADGEAYAAPPTPVDGAKKADRNAAPNVPSANAPADVQPLAEAAPGKWAAGQSQTFSGTLKPNESVFLALQRLDVPHAAIHNAVTAVGQHFDFRKARPGDTWEATVGADGIVHGFRYQTGPEDIYVANFADGKHTGHKVDVATEARRETIGGTIESSLWGAFDRAGASANLSQAFIDTFMYSIDFNEDTQAGDTFAAVSESVYLDGQKIRDGRLHAAKYKGQSGTFYAFAHTHKDGSVAYYDAEGDSLKRQFLKTPLPVTRVTSKFGRRVHPVLGKAKMHNGVDYGAPVGTPIFAAADGVVTFAGFKGANGNLVSIRHSGGYVTHYAHLSKISPGIKAGKKVQQRDVIAKSGNTGRSTGPHLHYGMTKNGNPINPLTVEFTRGEPLKGKERQAFKARVEELMKQLN